MGKLIAVVVNYVSEKARIWIDPKSLIPDPWLLLWGCTAAQPFNCHLINDRACIGYLRCTWHVLFNIHNSIMRCCGFFLNTVLMSLNNLPHMLELGSQELGMAWKQNIWLLRPQHNRDRNLGIWIYIQQAGRQKGNEYMTGTLMEHIQVIRGIKKGCCRGHWKTVGGTSVTTSVAEWDLVVCMNPWFSIDNVSKSRLLCSHWLLPSFKIPHLYIVFV